MKKLFTIIMLAFIVISHVGAEYIEGQENEVKPGWIMTTSLEIENTSASKMHPSWDIDNDGINDCEKYGTCDHTIDYTQEKPEMKVCTMEYAPVCAEVQVQCIKAPCEPVTQTFSNRCMAGENKILYQGQCNSLVDSQQLKVYQAKNDDISKKLENISDRVLIKMVERLDEMISATEKSRIAVWMQKQKITKYVYLKNAIQIELNSK